MLLIESDEHHATFLKALLQNARYDHISIEVVSTYEAGALTLQTQPPDVCLLAETLRDQQGRLRRASELLHEVAQSHNGGTQTIGKMPMTTKVPVIVLAEQDDLNCDREVMEAGAIDYLVRPAIDGAQLERAIRYARQRKRTEHLHRESEAYIRAITESVTDAIITIDANSIIQNINRAAEPIFGYEIHEVLGQPLTLLIPEDLRDRHQRSLDRYLDTDLDTGHKRLNWQVVETVGRHQSGRDISIEISFSDFEHDGQKYFTGIIRDITERKKTEREIGQSEELFRTVVTNSGEGLVQTDRNNVIVSVNERLTQMLGYSVEEMTGRLLYDFMDEEGRRRAEEQFEQRRQGINEIHDFRFLKRDGSEVWTKSYTNSLTDEQGNFMGALGMIADITEHKRAEDALRESERRHARITANAPGMVYQFVLHTDGSFEFPYINEGSREINNVDPVRLQEDPQLVFTIIHPDDRNSFSASIMDSARTLQSWKWTGRTISSEGEVSWIEGASRPERQDNGDTIWDGLLIDVTPRKRAEEELRRAHLELEQRVAQRTEELARTNQSLQIEIAVRERAEQHAQYYAQQQEAVADLSQQALAGVDLNTLLQSAVTIVGATLDVPMCCITQPLPDAKAFLLTHAVGWPAKAVGTKYFDVAVGSHPGYIVLAEGPVIVEDLRNETRFTPVPLLLEEGVVSALSVPIAGTNPEPLYGLLCVHTKQRRLFSSQDVQFLQAVANVLATAVASKHLEDALNESRGRLQAIIDNASAMIYIKDLEGHYVLVNKQIETLTNAPAAALLGLTDHDFFSAEIADAFRRNDLQVLQHRTPLQVEERIEFDGRTRVSLSTKFPLYDSSGNLNGLGGISTDITARKREEQTREEAYREAHRARGEADRANQAKSEFLSRMSHELRTPLNAILGFAQLLQLADLPARQKQNTDQILKAGKHLLNLINEVLDIARIETGHLTTSLEPVQLRRVLQEVIDLITPLAAGNDIRVHFSQHPDCECFVMADRRRLLQVFLNLLANAIKYNHAGGRVDFTCEISEKKRVVISVRDTGQGIAEENLARLWLPFERLDAENLGIEGTGLGLPLSRALVESMGGHLGVQSRQGQGSTFWVELTVCAEPAPAHQPSSPQTTANAVVTGTVLHIEDNPSNFLLLEQLLEHLPNLKLISAMQGGSGFDLARQHRPDLILLDLHLPDMHGSEVLQRLKEEAATTKIPVIIISADATPKQIARMMQQGACDYLTKPFDVQRLLLLINALLHADKSEIGTQLLSNTPLQKKEGASA